MDNPEVAKHIQALNGKHLSVCSDAVEALVEIGTAAVPALIQALKDGDFHGRRNSIQVLRGIGDAATVSVFVEESKAKDRIVRMVAVLALGEIGDTVAIPALIQALNDEDNSVSTSASMALQNIGAAAVPALIEASKDKSKKVRLNAAYVLGRIGDAESLPRKILAASQILIPERINVLADLRRVCYRVFDSYRWITLRYAFPETRTLCQTVLQEDDAAARAGAQAVLDWLNGRDLLRAAQRDTATEPQELLRAAQEETISIQPETLLREASTPQANADKPAPRRTLRERLFGK